MWMLQVQIGVTKKIGQIFSNSASAVAGQELHTIVTLV